MRKLATLLLIFGISNMQSQEVVSDNLQEIYDSSVKKISKTWESRGVEMRGSMYIPDNDLLSTIEMWGISTKRFDDEEIALNYIYTLANDVLNELNSNKILRKYLRNYPLKRNDIFVSVAFNTGTIGDHYPPPAYALVGCCYGKVSMKVYENGQFKKVRFFEVE